MEKREIKFKYVFETVNGNIEKIYYVYEIPSIEKKCDVWNDLELLSVNQYTGFKDFNGNEIYENDTINAFDGKDYKVKFSEKLGVWTYCEIGFEYNTNILGFEIRNGIPEKSDPSTWAKVKNGQ